MSQQHPFADARYAIKRRTTCRAQFLTEMDQMILSATLEGIVAPHCQTSGRGRRPLPLGTMLHVLFL